MSEIKKINAVIKDVLFEVGEPLLLLLERKAGTGHQFFIASAIPDEFGETEFYLVVSVGRTNLIRYFGSQCDLRFLFAFANGRKFYRINARLGSVGSKVSMIEFTEPLTDNLLPDTRFFATEHTSSFGQTQFDGGGQKLVIDGEWDMLEFGKFYQRFSDLYSYQQAIEYVQSKDQRADRVTKAFRSKPFRGGSSYMNFFDDLFEIIPARERPGLDGIEYHSPGYVDLRGKNDVLEAVQASLEEFLAKGEEIQKAHDALRGFMSKEKLLVITGASVVAKPEVLKVLAGLVADLIAVLPVSGKDQLKELTGGNLVVLGKVCLALFRRLKTTSNYFAQGRLQFT